MDLLTPRGMTYLATAPGELGLARAYVAGDIEARGVHPGDPYELLALLTDKLDFTKPSPRLLASDHPLDRHPASAAGSATTAGGATSLAPNRRGHAAQQDS